MTELFLKLIRFYKAAISPYNFYSCRYFPSCSDYALESIKRKGLIRGGYYSFIRILSCNPFSKGGIDLP